MEIYKETKGDLTILTADGLDINQDLADRVYLKDLVSKLRFIDPTGMKGEDWYKSRCHGL